MDEEYKEAIKDFLGPSQYLGFTEDNDFTIEGRFMGLTNEDDPFNPGQTRLVLSFEIEDPKEGKVIKTLGTGSRKLAKKLMALNPKVGDLVRIKRYGEKFETNYEVKVTEAVK